MSKKGSEIYVNPDNISNVSLEIEREVSLQIGGEITFGKKHIYFGEQNKKSIQKTSNEKRINVQVSNFFSSSIQSRTSPQNDVDYPQWQGNEKQTSVISQKQQFAQEENGNRSRQQLISHLKIRQKSSNQEQNSKPNSRQTIETYPKQEDQTSNQICESRQEQFQTERGWLEYCVNGNNKVLYKQIDSLLNFNTVQIMEIEKVQLRAKIIELQIETNKLKIGLRRSSSTKHINFSVDFKFNFQRPPLVRVPKKVDTDLRKYCKQLQKSVNQLRIQHQQNSKTLFLVQFYHNQFKNKVNFTYIYHQHLLEKENKMQRKKSNLNVNQEQSNKNSSISKNLGTKRNQETSQQKSFLKTQTTIAAEKLQTKRSLNNMRKLTKVNGQNETSRFLSPQMQKKVVANINNLNLKEAQQQISHNALFSLRNPIKKHFYYQCQKCFQQIQKEYKLKCKNPDNNILQGKDIDFRQRELSKMKILQMKNEILDTETDVIMKQKQLTKQIQILKKELELISTQINTKFSNNALPNNSVLSKKDIKDISKSRISLHEDYPLLYRQAERKLKSFKSSQLLQKVSKINMKNSPSNANSQLLLLNQTNKLVSTNNVDASSLKLETKQSNQEFKNPQNSRYPQNSKNQFKKPQPSTEKRLINRLKTNSSLDNLNNLNENNKLKKSNTKVNPEKNLMYSRTKTFRLIQKTQTQVVEQQYYAM